MPLRRKLLKKSGYPPGISPGLVPVKSLRSLPLRSNDKKWSLTPSGEANCDVFGSPAQFRRDHTGKCLNVSAKRGAFPAHSTCEQ